MKSKYFVIFILALTLSTIIYLMIRIENRYFMGNSAPTLASNVTGIPQVDNREEVMNLSDKDWTDHIDSVRLFSKAYGDYISMAKTSRGQRLQESELVYEPQFLKGVNLGVATPGSFPGEFAASKEQYYQWLLDIGKMNANTIRIYTILPPIFYTTFARYNDDHPEKPLWLLQGIWTEQPSEGDYFDKDFVTGFNREIRDAIDVIFGRANLSPRSGHASGKYVVDVSRHTMGFILGREWEPQSITRTNKAHRDIHSYRGRFFSVPDGNQMEVFLATCMDYLMTYETSAHGFQHPVSFVNWLPLDPMYHNSEWLEGEKISEFDNDLESIDPMRIFTTPSNKAGYFASYHVYPYYPDFIYNDSTYRNSQCSRGQCSYSGYINDLKAHHRGLPLVIAEYGVPSSRSSSHSMPMGMNQGRHTENEQGQINAHLTDDIFNSDCAGAMLFSWIDEWFKHNWLVMEFEIPADRNRFWHNIEDPEQCFGMAALEDCRIQIDGSSEDWNETPTFKDKTGDIALYSQSYQDIKSLQANADASCLYIKIDLNAPIPVLDTNLWQHFGMLVGIDSYDKEKGDHYISQIDDTLGYGAEFLIDIRGPGHTSILVDKDYDVCNEYPIDAKPKFHSVNNSDGIFNIQKMIPNRRRFSLTGEEFPKVVSYRGDLKWASEQLKPAGDCTLDDIAFCDQGRAIEMRIPWALLNITDPSSLAVLDDKPETDYLDFSVTSGIHFYLFTYDPSSSSHLAVDKLPDDPSGRGIKYSWKPWEKPEYKYRLKYGYQAMAEIFDKIDSPKVPYRKAQNKTISPTARLTKWPKGKDGAVTITFDDASHGQYKYGLPIIQKYNQAGTFFILTGWVGDENQIAGEDGGLQTLRLSWPQIKEISENGFEIGAHGFVHKPLDNKVTDTWIKNTFTKSKSSIEQHINGPCVSMSYPYSVITEPRMRLMTNLGFLYGRRGGSIPNDYSLDNFMSLYSYPVIDTARPHYSELSRELRNNGDKWTVMLFHHIFPENATEWKTFNHYNVKDTYSLTPLDFERFIRLIRNQDFASGTIRQIGDYLRIAKSTTLDFGLYDSYYTLSLNNQTADKTDKVIITLELQTPWRYVQVDGSISDGVYEIRDGFILLNALAGSTVIVRKLASDQ